MDNMHKQYGPDWYSNLAQSPFDGSILTGSMDHSVRLWDLETCRQLQRFEGHTGWPRAVGISRDGRRIITGSRGDGDPSARIWDVALGEELLRLQHSTKVHSVAFSPDVKTVLTGAEDQTARVWDSDSGQLLATYSGHESWVKSVAYLPVSDRFLTVSGTEAIVWKLLPGHWHKSSKACLHVHWARAGLLQCVATSPDGRFFAVGSEQPAGRRTGGGIEVTEMESRELVMFETPGKDCSVYGVTFSPCGGFLMSGHADKTARLWSTRDFSLVREFRAGHLDPVHSCLFLQDGRRALTCGENHRIHCWDLSTGEEVLRRRVTPDGIVALPVDAPKRISTAAIAKMSIKDILGAAREERK